MHSVSHVHCQNKATQIYKKRGGGTQSSVTTGSSLCTYRYSWATEPVERFANMRTAEEDWSWRMHPPGCNERNNSCRDKWVEQHVRWMKFLVLLSTWQPVTPALWDLTPSSGLQRQLRSCSYTSPHAPWRVSGALFYWWLMWEGPIHGGQSNP